MTTTPPAEARPAGLGRYRNSMRQFVRFGLVGGSGVVVNMLVAILLNKLHGGTENARDILFPLVGRFSFRFSHLVWVVGFLVANLTNFQLNRSWTFQSSRHAKWWREFWPFLAVGSVAAVIGLFLKIAMTDPTSPLYLPEPWFHEARGLRSREYWGQLIAILVTVPVNFVVNKLWTFRAVRSHHLAEAPAVPAPGLVDTVIEEEAEQQDAPHQVG